MLVARGTVLLGTLLLPGLFAADELEEELDLTIWDRSVNLRGAFGYKDNVLLSKVQPEGSAFWQTALDFMLLRASLEGGPNLTFFASGEDRRYFSSSEVQKEQLFLAQGKIEQSFAEAWTGSAIAQYVYADQVFDASATEEVLETLPVKSHNLQFAPALARELPWNSQLELKFTAERQYFNDPLDDYWEIGPQLSWTRKYRNRSEFSLSYTYDYRMYDTRQHFSLAFERIPGTSLRFQQHEIEASVNHSWDKDRKWRSRLRLFAERNDDNGPGFYDYTRYRVSKRFGYYGADWEASVEGRILHYNYDRQPVSTGDAVRENWEYILSLHVDKMVWKRLKIFAESAHEWVQSNYFLEEYEVNTVLGGVDWEF